MRSLCYENQFSFIESRANYRAEYFAHKLNLKKKCHWGTQKLKTVNFAMCITIVNAKYYLDPLGAQCHKRYYCHVTAFAVLAGIGLASKSNNLADDVHAILSVGILQIHHIAEKEIRSEKANTASHRFKIRLNAN